MYSLSLLEFSKYTLNDVLLEISAVVAPEDLVTLPKEGFISFVLKHSKRTSSSGAGDDKEI